MAKKNVIDLAKSNKKTTKSAKKPTAKKTVVKEPTPEELRDQKAKAKVNELLKDSPITTLTKKDEDVLEFEEQTPDEPKGVEWLEEQITLLSVKNKELTTKMEEVKIDFEKILKENQELKTGSFSGDGHVKKQVIILFNELQENYIRMGPNFMVYFPAFLNRMIKFFPFLSEVKKYN